MGPGARTAECGFSSLLPGNHDARRRSSRPDKDGRGHQSSVFIMPERLTIFYSWQSDTPSRANRNFVEKALREALKRLHSDATLESALREANLELDKDTQGVAGSPPITETILAKIQECTAFIADLTFVGQSLKAITR